MTEFIIFKRLGFLGSSRKDLKEFPREVRSEIGFALSEVQKSKMPVSAKPLKGFGGAGVIEIIENFLGGTYRAVYTVRFEKVIYVLHCFQKKSKHGIKPPRREIELIQQRLRAAKENYKQITNEVS